MAGVVVGVKVVVGIGVGVMVVVGVGAGVLVVAVEDSEINTWDILKHIVLQYLLTKLLKPPCPIVLVNFVTDFPTLM